MLWYASERSFPAQLAIMRHHPAKTNKPAGNLQTTPPPPTTQFSKLTNATRNSVRSKPWSISLAKPTLVLAKRKKKKKDFRQIQFQKRRKGNKVSDRVLFTKSTHLSLPSETFHGVTSSACTNAWSKSANSSRPGSTLVVTWDRCSLGTGRNAVILADIGPLEGFLGTFGWI